MKINSWKEFFVYEEEKEYFTSLKKFLENEYTNYRIFPSKENVMKAFDVTHFKDVKVVIIGQDPYHEDGQGMGLAFSVNDGVKIPPSLRNIYKELELEGFKPNKDTGNLTKWAEQGVFLINSCLTVREHQANSHAGKGWEFFTDNAIRALNDDNKPKVFVLWGNFAQKKECLIDSSVHLVLKTAHPSPLSANRGFFGCNHFLKINEFLKQNNTKGIEW